MIAFLILLFSITQCNVWDNIFSQTLASSPIVLKGSFNLDLSLADEYFFNGYIDLNQKLNVLTFTLYQNIFNINVNIFKAQLDLSEFILNVDESLLGCLKYTFEIKNENATNFKNQIQTKKISKRQFFLINLFFKFIGKYLDQSKIDLKNQFKSILINKSIDQAFNEIRKEQKHSVNQDLNIFQFSADFLYSSNFEEQIKKSPKIKREKGEDNFNEELNDFSLADFDLSILKFVILTDSNTGEIAKAFKNRNFDQELTFSLESLETEKLQCPGEAKILNLQNLVNETKSLSQNTKLFDHQQKN